MLARSVSVKLFARYGELAQGLLENGSTFLFSGFVSDKYYSEITVSEFPGNTSLPEKSLHAYKLFYDTYSIRNRANLSLTGNIIHSKGMSSSSTDVLGVLLALHQYHDINYTDEFIYDLAASIEPTDPCLFDGVTLLSESELLLFHHLSFSFVAFDTDPAVLIDTIQCKKKSNRKFTLKDQWILDGLKKALHARSINDIKKYSFESALLNQQFHSTHNFEVLSRFARDNHLGLAIAHTGTIAVIYSDPLHMQQNLKLINEFIKINYDVCPLEYKI